MNLRCRKRAALRPMPVSYTLYTISFWKRYLLGSCCRAALFAQLLLYMAFFSTIYIYGTFGYGVAQNPDGNDAATGRPPKKEGYKSALMVRSF